jgi:hypothetical protein
MVYNVTGYSELLNGNIFGATYMLYNNIVGGWLVALLFIVYQILIYLKTRNVVMMWVTGLIFAGMFAINQLILIVNPSSMVFIFAILVIELAGIFYYLLFK